MRRTAGNLVVSAVLFIMVLLLFSCSGKGLSSFDGLPEAEGGMQSELLAVVLKPSSPGSENGIGYFELDAVNEDFFTPPESDAALAVTSFGPEGSLPVEMKRPDIYLTFNQPMVPLSTLGEPGETHPFLFIEPPLEGSFRWYGSRLLSFEPAEPLAGQRDYRVVLRKGIESLGGKRLEEPFEFSFHTEYLDFAEVYAGTPGQYGEIDQDDVSPQDARFITVEFTYPVDGNYLAQFLRVRTGGVEYSFTAMAPPGEMEQDRRERTLVLRLDSLLPEERDVEVVLTAGAASEADYLGRPDDSIRRFHTLKPFRFLGLRSYSRSFPRSREGDANPVFLEFSHPLNNENLADHITTSLDVADLSAHLQGWERIIKLNNLPVDYDSRYQLTIGTGVTDIYGRSLDAPQALEVEVGPAARYYYFPDTGSRMLEAGFDKKIIYEYQNVFAGLWKIDTIDDPYVSFAPEQLQPYDFSRLSKNVKHYEVLDLSPYLNPGGYGTVGISWNFGELDEGKRNRWEQRNLQLQVTDIGITTRVAYNKVLVWAASLATGAPLAGAEVQLMHNQNSKRRTLTDATGLAVFDLSPGEYRTLFIEAEPEQESEREYDRLRIRVTQGADSAEFMPNGYHNPYHFGIYAVRGPETIEKERMEAFLFTDRGLYKQGETVTFRGIDRSWIAGEYSSYRGPYSIAVSEQRYRAESFIELSGTSSASGGFYGSFALPEELEPGDFWIIYRRGGQEQRIPFTVAQFRRAQFEVRLASPPERSYLAGDSLSAAGQARYLSGGSVAGAPYTVLWMREPAFFRPPGEEWQKYSFTPYSWRNRVVVAENQGRLSGDGTVRLRQESGTDQIPGIPYRYQAELAVQDEARQELASRTSFMVHPAEFYIASRFESDGAGWWSTFVGAGEEVEVEALFVSPEGTRLEEAPAAARAVLIKKSWQLSRRRGVYGRLNNRYELVEEEIAEYGLTPRMGKLSFSFVPPVAGEYDLRISAVDEAGRRAVSEISFYATGSGYVQWNQSDPKDIELEADKEEYRPGETARLLVKSPLAAGRYLLTLEREGILDERIIELEGSAASIEIPIEESYLPVVYVALSSYTPRGEPPTSYFDPDLGKPRGLFGIRALKVSPESRALELSMSPNKELYRPGERGRVRISVRSGGRPVEGAEVTFLAVDRGVVDLIDYHVPDPMDYFYADYKFPLGVVGADSRSLLINPVNYEVKDLKGGDGDEEGKLKRRKEFSPLAVFEPFLVTGPDGSVEAAFTFPDTLTTYRATAVAVKENRFGRGERELAVQNPITLRAALPRKLRLRDTAEAGVVLTNLSGQEQSVTLAAASLNESLRIAGDTERRVVLDPGESREISFTLLATTAGKGKLEFTLRSDLVNEVLEALLEVELPRTVESFTVAGTLEETGSVQEGLVIPASIAPGFGELKIELNPNPLGTVTSVVHRLLATDYQIIEGEMARVLPHLLLGDKLGLFESVYDPQGLAEFFAALKAYQNRDGGFGFNPGSGYSSPSLSVRLAHYTALAQARGINPEGVDRDRLVEYLASMAKTKGIPPQVSLYSLYVRTLHGDRPEKELSRALEAGDSLGLSGYGFLALSYLKIGGTARAREITARMEKFLKLSTRSLDLVETYESRSYFDSELTQLALLQMLIYRLGDRPELLDRVGRSLVSRGRYGRWGSLLDSEIVLISYAERLASFIESGGRVEAEVRLEDQLLLEASSASDVPEVRRFPLFEPPLDSLPRNTLLSLDFSRRGEAPLFYSGTIRYALPAEVAPPRDEGFSVYTRLETLDGDETERLTAGMSYRMRVVASSARDRSMALLRVPVPSGCEIVDAALVTSRSYAGEGGVTDRSFERETVYGETATFTDEGFYYPDLGFFRTLAPEQKILDNEVRYYFRHFYAGKEELTFLIRAVTPGIFPTPPAKIEGIYEEEVFGRGAGRLVRIE